MRGHNRSKNGVAFARLCPAHPRLNAASAMKTWMAGTSPAMTDAVSFLRHVARRRLGGEPAATAREGVPAALVPGAVDGAAGKDVPGGVPVAERVAVPGRARRPARRARPTRASAPGRPGT